ncbi:MAG: carboxypeptidase-like regulatory domain-containing protein [Thermoproteota archaeon]
MKHEWEGSSGIINRITILIAILILLLQLSLPFFTVTVRLKIDLPFITSYEKDLFSSTYSYGDFVRSTVGIRDLTIESSNSLDSIIFNLFSKDILVNGFVWIYLLAVLSMFFSLFFYKQLKPVALSFIGIYLILQIILLLSFNFLSLGLEGIKQKIVEYYLSLGVNKLDGLVRRLGISLPQEVLDAITHVGAEISSRFFKLSVSFNFWHFLFSTIISLIVAALEKEEKSPSRKLHHLSLTVLDFESGPPVSSARVFLDGIYRGETDANGVLNVRRVPTGSHTLTIEASGFERKMVEVKIPEQQKLTVFLKRIEPIKPPPPPPPPPPEEHVREKSEDITWL